MARVFKLLLKIIVVLLLLYALLAIALQTLIKPNHYKPLIVSQVSQATGMRLTINGEVKLSLFPWIGVDIKKAQLDNPKGFQSPAKAAYFVKIGDAAVHIAILPLLTGKIEARKIVLSGTNINLVLNEKGQANWDSLMAKSAPTKPSDKKADDNGAIVIPKMLIKKTNIHYIDVAKGETLTLRNINFATVPEMLNNLTAIRASFELVSANPASDIKVNLKTKLAINNDAQHFTFHDLNVSGSIKSLEAPLATAIPFALKSKEVVMDSGQNTFMLSNIDASFADMKIQGDMQSNEQNGAMITKGNINVDPFNAKTLVKDLFPQYQGSSEAFSQFGLKMRLVHYRNVIKVKQLLVQLDKSKLSGDITYSQLKQPKLEFNLKLDKINLDNYASQKTTRQQAGAAKGVTVSQNKQNITSNRMPFVWDGKLYIGELTYNNTPCKNIRITSNGNPENMSVSPILANIAGGELKASLRATNLKQNPDYRFSMQLDNAQAGQLLSTPGERPVLDGLLKTKVELNTRGLDQEAMLNHLNGKGAFLVQDGLVRGVNIAGLIDIGTGFMKGGIPGVGILNKLTQQKTKDSDITQFLSLGGSFVIANGILTNNDLAIDTTVLSAQGAGQIDLRNMTFKRYRVGAQYRDDSDFMIPVILSGPLDNPSFTIDVANLGKSTVKGLFKKGINLPMDRLRNLIP